MDPRTSRASRTGLVVRLDLPDQSDIRRHALEHEPFTPDGQVDPDRVARIVEELLAAVAPGLHPQVRVELVQPVAEPVALQAVPSSGLLIDVESRTLAVDGRPVLLTRREFELLAYLHRRRGVALGRGELMSAVWRTGYLDGDRTVDVHVRRLRVKLGRHADRVTTLRGFGYRFD